MEEKIIVAAAAAMFIIIVCFCSLRAERFINTPRRAGAPMLDEIAPGVYLGNWGDSISRGKLRRAGIGAVLTINSEHIHTPDDEAMYVELGIAHKRLEARDDAGEDITRILPEALEFINKHRRGGRAVLVHCSAGVSRSVSVVAAHLMSRGHTYGGALERIRAVRPIARPNSAFQRQLRALGAARRPHGA